MNCFSVDNLGMNEEHLELKNKFSNCFVKNAFLTNIHEFLKTSILSLGYLGFQKTKLFCIKLNLKTRIKINVHPLSPLTRFLVTTNFRGNHVLMQGLKRCEKEI